MNDNNLPKELEKIIGKEYIFQLRLDEYNLKYGRENYTVSRIFDPNISEKNSTSNEAEIKKVIVQYIYLIMNSLVFKRHNEFVTLTHINMYLGFFFFFWRKGVYWLFNFDDSYFDLLFFVSSHSRRMTSNTKSIMVLD